MKNKILIEKAIKIMNQIDDPEHNMMHIKDVLYYKDLLIKNIKCNEEVLLIACYWHDVGRIKCDIGHELESSIMLKETMVNLRYDDTFINECILAIKNHKWNMKPTTLEGKILKDADKLSWLGENRWDECIKKGKKLDSIISLLPKLRNEILELDESRLIYDNEIEKFKNKYKIEFEEY